jgi:outer membrane protein OmpA-like peptidoglycan-associated protein
MVNNMNVYRSWVMTFVLLQSSCVLWPEKGQGGEADQFTFSNYYEPAAVLHETEAYLLSQLETLRSQLDVLTLQGAVHCIPASVKRLNLLSHRVRREIASHLLVDAAHDLVVFQHEIRFFRQQFLTIAEQTQCNEFASSTSPMSQAIISVYFDSSQSTVSPIFIDQIRWWAEHWTESTQIIIKGYTDANGSDDVNLQLAQKRINSVQSILLSVGVDPKSVSSNVIGERSLMLQGSDDFSTGMNRRVDIFISNSDNTKQRFTVKRWEALGLKSHRHLFKSWD